MLMTLRTAASWRSASPTSRMAVGSMSVISTLANSGLLSRYWVRSSRPCSSIESRKRSSASARET